MSIRIAVTSAEYKEAEIDGRWVIQSLTIS